MIIIIESKDARINIDFQKKKIVSGIPPYTLPYEYPSAIRRVVWKKKVSFSQRKPYQSLFRNLIHVLYMYFFFTCEIESMTAPKDRECPN